MLTSVAHTYFLQGNYKRAVETYGTKGGYYLDCAALAAMGEEATALSKLRAREQAGAATGSVQAIMCSLRAYLEGNSEQCVATILGHEAALRGTPESLFYAARHLARVNEIERAISTLFDVVNCGFLCGSVIMHDPWIDSLRLSPRFSELLQFAEMRRKEAHGAFLSAGGEEVLALDNS
jgi:hypothetical protein